MALIKCRECGKEISDQAVACPGCGCPISPSYSPAAQAVAYIPAKNKTTAILLALFLGGVGAHKFYLGKNLLGLIYLLTCWTFVPAILGFIEALILMGKDDDEFNTRFSAPSQRIAITHRANSTQQEGTGRQSTKTSPFVYIVLGLIAVFFVAANCSSIGTPEHSAADKAATEQREIKEAAEEIRRKTAESLYASSQERVKKLFQNNPKEPAAKDAAWTSTDIFKVAVFDNHKDRSGYADYVCQVLYENGFKGKKIWVQIIDVVKLTRSNQWEKLGEAHCL